MIKILKIPIPQFFNRVDNGIFSVILNYSGYIIQNSRFFQNHMVNIRVNRTSEIFL
nr:MAG TPA: hypothetical protein [Caudoviricetes sp.]